ncbi:MAG: hypothetical protein KGJ62_05660 [Armatimonadetes bacterium]|nr:hypothetical protein [Armatimonadota bacterium]
MTDAIDIEQYVKDPDLLVELCRQVCDELRTNSPTGEVVQCQAQLREIAKAVERLEKAGVTVPEALRAEKTRLAAALAVNEEASKSLASLSGGLKSILEDIGGRRIGPTI